MDMNIVTSPELLIEELKKLEKNRLDVEKKLEDTQLVFIFNYIIMIIIKRHIFGQHLGYPQNCFIKLMSTLLSK